MSADFDDDEFLKELQSTFLEEAMDLSSRADEVLLALSSYDEESFAELFRVAHTIKGSAASSEFLGLSKFVHTYENLLTKFKNQEIPVSHQAVDFLIRCNDAIKNIIENLQQGIDEDTIITAQTGNLESELVASVEGNLAWYSPPSRTEEKKSGLANEDQGNQPAFGFFEDDIENATNEEDKSEDEHEHQAFGFFDTEDKTIAPESESRKLAEVDGAKKGVDKQEKLVSDRPQANKVASQSIKVSSDKLNALLDIAGELVTLNSEFVRRKIDLGSAFPDLKASFMALDKMTRALHDMAQSLRMVPIKPVFQKMQRIVRDVATQTGKEVTFNISGEYTEIEKSLVELIDGPLVHIIRNAVDHGIESADERKSSGKTGGGIVSLTAKHEGSSLVLEIKDDGKGINKARVLEKAIEKGVVHSSDNLTDDEINNLIFHPGFSTAKEVSAISGRGVGMDVVKTTIQSLKGSVEIKSVEGQGSTFIVKLPLSLSIVDGMMIGISGQSYVIPLDLIEETVQPKLSDVTVSDGRDELLNIRGEAVHLRYLSALIGIGDKPSCPAQGMAMVVSCEGKKYALLVDEIYGRGQVVTKTLGQNLDHLMKGVNGAAVTAGGNVSLILDPRRLLIEREGGMHAAA